MKPPATTPATPAPQPSPTALDELVCELIHEHDMHRQGLGSCALRTIAARHINRAVEAATKELREMGLVELGAHNRNVFEWLAHFDKLNEQLVAAERDLTASTALVAKLRSDLDWIAVRASMNGTADSESIKQRALEAIALTADTKEERK